MLNNKLQISKKVLTAINLHDIIIKRHGKQRRIWSLKTKQQDANGTRQFKLSNQPQLRKMILSESKSLKMNRASKEAWLIFKQFLLAK